MSHVAVIGAGAWGTALARVLAANQPSVSLWTWQSSHAESMRQLKQNQEFLPGFALPENVSPTSDLQGALDGAGLALLAVPSQVMRTVLEQAQRSLQAVPILINATKGIEEQSLKLMSEVAVDVLGAGVADAFVVVSGPSFAKEVAMGMPTNVVVAGTSPSVVAHVQSLFSYERIRAYTSDDVLGVQLGGALKNVIAIAAGACDGIGLGNNTRAALITRGIAEITRLAVRRGANPLTLAGLAGLGDLVLTCTGELSRNRTVGFELGRGRRLDEVLAGLGHVAEGVHTTKSAHAMARQFDVDLPITTEVYNVLFDGKAPLQALKDLVARPLRRELD
jgi:glycerol-3-phosphate dehydrogenase (NAD(P)+)